MSDVLRRSPSGEPFIINTDDIVNDSDVPGATLTDALDTLEAGGVTVGSPGETVRVGPSSNLVGVPGTIAGQLWFWNGTTWEPSSTGPSDDYIPSWNAAGNTWGFIPIPTIGDIQYFDTTHSPVGLWNFNDTLADFSGNGNTMVLENGVTSFADIVPGKKGVWIAANVLYGVPTPQSELALLGDMTILSIVQLNNNPTTTFQLVNYGNPGSAIETGNYLYTMNIVGTAVTIIPINIGAFWETGVGVSQTFTTGAPFSLPPIHNIIFVAQVRSASGTRVQNYVNGKPFGALSGALTAPTGGSLSRLRLGGLSVASPAVDTGIVMSLKIVGSALSAAEILAEYNRTLGPGFGILT